MYAVGATRFWLTRVCTRAVQDDAFMLKHEYELSRMLHMMTMQKSASNSSSGVTRATLHIELCIRRLPAYWFWNVSLPLFFFTGISFASFAVEVTALADRLSITITILLTLVAYRFAIVDRLPNVDHLTLLDLYIQLCFVVVVAITVHAVALAVRAESSLVQLTAPGAIWSVPDAWQGSQRVALWACSTAWIALNAAIYPCVWLSRRIAAWQPENLQWWDSVDDLLWVGGKPIGIWKLKAEKQTDLLSALQKAINAVIEDAEVVVPSRPDAAMMQPVVLLGVTFSSDELATLTTSKSGKIYHTAEAQQPRLSFTARQPSQPEPAIYGMPPRTKSRLYGRKLLPDSSGTCAVLQFDSALQAQHAQLAISEAVSLECVTCREKCRVEGSSVYIRRAAKLKDTAILAPADDWEQRLAELAKCLRHVDKPAACATCGRALQERAGATAPMSAADSLEDKERAKAAAAAEIVCEIALPEYKRHARAPLRDRDARAAAASHTDARLRTPQPAEASLVGRCAAVRAAQTARCGQVRDVPRSLILRGPLRQHRRSCMSRSMAAAVLLALPGLLQTALTGRRGSLPCPPHVRHAHPRARRRRGCWRGAGRTGG